MYKIYIKYFGELINEISGIDGSGDCAENYELGEEYIVENADLLKEKINSLIENSTNEVIGNMFVVDNETEIDINKIVKTIEDNKEYIIRLFWGEQENWNSYYEIIITKYNKERRGKGHGPFGMGPAHTEPFEDRPKEEAV